MGQPLGIVVGIDGSEGSHRALEWAVAEAGRWGQKLTLVHAWRFGVSPADPTIAEATREIGRAAKDLLDDEVAFARSAGSEATGVLVFEGAVHALVEASEDADLLVVGSRGRGPVTGALLGSVSQGCARHARCPVVIVPEPERAAAHAQPVTAAVDACSRTRAG
jgi:nucleotide-binding universal stress UspA family protein